MMNNGFFNPYTPGFQYPQANPFQQQPQKYEVIKVAGRPGVDAFQMAPNSSVLLLDETAPIVWLVTTDGAGYKTVTPYDITPHQVAPAPDFGSLESRIKRLEDMINGDSTDSFAIKRRSKHDSDGQTGESHAWRNAEPTSSPDPNR